MCKEKHICTIQAQKVSTVEFCPYLVTIMY